MKKKRPSKIEIAVRIAVAIMVLCTTIVSAFVSAPIAEAQTETTYPTFVVSSTHVDNPEGGMSYDVDCPDSATINNYADAEVVYDFGQIFSVYRVAWGGGTYQPNHDLDLYISTDGETWGDPVWGLSYGPGCNEHFETPNLYVSARYVRIVGKDDTSAHLDVLALILADESTPTPTPNIATPLPAQPTACITAMPSATATRQASPTPLIQRTATPTRTPTPGGPTATPGPSATGTPVPSFDSGIATFAQSLQPWTATEHFEFGGLYVTEWRSTNGPDGVPGVAFTKDFVGLLDNPSGPLTTTEPLSGSLTFSRPGGMFFPFRVTGSVKWSASILGGESAYLRVWYFDPDYISPGQGAWVTDPPNWRDQFSSDWGHFSFSLTQHGGSGRVTAVAISEELDGTERSGEGALLDNLRVYSGPQAVAGSFPVCQGTGGTGPRPIETKFCNIKQVLTDVYATCKAPDGFDVAGWLAYLYCRLVIYFQFLPQNRQQITDLIARQNADEPFGTFIEVSNITAVIGDMFSSISSTYGANAVTYRTVDWSTLFNFRQLDDIVTLLHIPNDPGVVERYRSRCPVLSDDNMNSQLFRNYGCLMIVFTRDQIPFFGAWQWVIDISSIIGLVIYAKSVLFKTQK